MKRLVTAVLAGVTVLVASAPLAAHDQYHVVGVITKRQPMVIVVKPDGPIASSIELEKHTVIVRDDKQVDAKELKVGTTVVVDALGDTPENMVAVFIRIVPPIKKAK